MQLHRRLAYARETKREEPLAIPVCKCHHRHAKGNNSRDGDMSDIELLKLWRSNGPIPDTAAIGKAEKVCTKSSAWFPGIVFTQAKLRLGPDSFANVGHSGRGVPHLLRVALDVL